MEEHDIQCKFQFLLFPLHVSVSLFLFRSISFNFSLSVSCPFPPPGPSPASSRPSSSPLAYLPGVTDVGSLLVAKSNASRNC